MIIQALGILKYILRYYKKNEINRVMNFLSNMVKWINYIPNLDKKIKPHTNYMCLWLILSIFQTSVIFFSGFQCNKYMTNR